jgi:hypothetical protein
MSEKKQVTFRGRFLQIGLRGFLLLCPLIGFGTAIGSRYGQMVHNTVRSVSQLEKQGFWVQSDFIDRYGLYAANRKTTLRSTFEWGLSQPTEIMALNPTRYAMHDSLRLIANLQGVQILKLNHVELDRGDLRMLGLMNSLVQLELQGTSVQDADLGALVGMSRLKQLDLSATRITDKGLETVARMKSLRMLTVYDTSVSPTGLASLKRVRPDLIVNVLLPEPVPLTVDENLNS